VAGRALIGAAKAVRPERLADTAISAKQLLN
jgi:hypothetical protein